MGGPVRLLSRLERAKRFELSTLTLARLCSTPELRPHPVWTAADLGGVLARCKGKTRGVKILTVGKAEMCRMAYCKAHPFQSTHRVSFSTLESVAALTICP